MTVSNLEQALETARELFADLSFEYARRWKVADSSRRVGTAACRPECTAVTAGSSAYSSGRSTSRATKSPKSWRSRTNRAWSPSTNTSAANGREL